MMLNGNAWGWPHQSTTPFNMCAQGPVRCPANECRECMGHIRPQAEGV